MIVVLKPVLGAALWPEEGSTPAVDHCVLTGTCSLHAGQAASKWRDRIRRSFSAPRGRAPPEPERMPSSVRSRGDSEQREPIMERIYPAEAVSASQPPLTTAWWCHIMLL